MAVVKDWEKYLKPQSQKVESDPVFYQSSPTNKEIDAVRDSIMEALRAEFVGRPMTELTSQEFAKTLMEIMEINDGS